MTLRRPQGTGTLRERPPGSGKWQLRVFFGRDPVTGHPVQHAKTVTAKSKNDAQRQLNAWYKELDGQKVGSSTATMAQLLDDYIRHSEARGRAPRTVHEARRTAEKVVGPVLGHVKVKELTPRHLDEFYRSLLERDPPLSAASVRRYHAVLSAALSQAVKWDLIERNPAERATPPELGQRDLVLPTDDEVRALIRAADEEKAEYGMLLKLAVLTAARRGELCALRWSDVMAGETGAALRIRRSIYRAGADRGEKGTKGKRERWVYLLPGAVEALASWRVRCETLAADLGVELAPDAFIVPGFPDGQRPVNPDSLSAAVYRIAGRLGISHVHLHSLRHYGATRMIEGGVNPRDAAEVLGHSDPRLTLSVYTHGTSARQREAMALLGRVLE